MARNYNIHVLTLAQVATLLRVDGSWPGPIGLSAGWFRAQARPWNEAVTDAMLRLERGGSEFLDAAAEKLLAIGSDSVYSPALYGGSTRVWRRSGFEDYASLDMMERALGVGPSGGAGDVRLEPDPDWEEILDVDREAFEGFWGMSILGLTEAYETNRSAALFVVPAGSRLAGYAIVGAQWGTVYLHRIAVRPADSGRGLGAALVAASIEWGARSRGGTMVLNVRPGNTRAKRLYRRLGFTDTGSSLQVLRRGAS